MPESREPKAKRPLPAQLQRKLELPRIEGRGRLLAAVPERVYVGYVELVDQVEDVHHGIERDPLAQRDAFRHPQVNEHVRGFGPGIAAEIADDGAIEEAGGLQESRRGGFGGSGRVAASVNRGSRGHDQRAVRRSGEIEVAIIAGDDVERPARYSFEDGRDGPVTEEFAREAVA